MVTDDLSEVRSSDAGKNIQLALQPSIISFE